MKMIWICLLLLAAGSLGAQTSVSLDPKLEIETIALYDGVPPGSAATSAAEMPTLTVFRPQQGRGNGTAVIVAPGGAYLGLASNLEGRQVADWFAVRGITAFVLRYRLGERNPFPIPLEDAQRAIRLVRSSAKSYGVSPGRIGIVGFSAGGHLAASAATMFHEGAGAAAGRPAGASAGGVDGVSDRPDFVVLGYPWLNAMEPQQAKEITYCSLLHAMTPAQCAAFAQEYTPKLHVTRRTPPVFLYATTDDAVVPVRASTEFYDAMVKAGAPVEMHLFRHGDHGSGMGLGDAALDLWPMLLEQWLRDQGLLTVDPAVRAAAR